LEFFRARLVGIRRTFLNGIMRKGKKSQRKNLSYFIISAELSLFHSVKILTKLDELLKGFAITLW